MLSLVPRPFTTATIAMEMPAAISPYSMAVAPVSSRRNLISILMIAESGICLACDVSHDAMGGGFWTTASAMGAPLIGRLQAKAGLTFTLENG